MEIFGVKVAELISEPALETLMWRIPQQKRERLKRFKRVEALQHSLIAELLVRVSLNKRLKVNNRDIEFVTNVYGKPSLKKRGGTVEFNISHSGEWVVCALDELPIGIDIEQIQQADLNIAKRFFSQDEYVQLTECEEMGRMSLFFDLWTLKESYIKAIGKGLSLPLNSFSFRLNNGIQLENHDAIGLYHFKQYHIDEKYKLAVCAQNPLFPGEVSVVNQCQFHQDCMQLLDAF
ncbi:hypothetical protein BSK66_16675 [Paenibacillus odorifer]|uniref:Uncharacterized protein n=1 Tax=Paenibacillus odorifer TaxID=189426 RepID=A0A1R0X693_9BACL|nr:phosphopantetheine--protein transferase [Paenibacillus sp. FSL H8-237]OMC97031.1 hypothetical protein BJP46_27115 [Paenibacillus odorifer]OMD02001.1 hypothetical protein BJP49_26835 [Paenibacillus odorifer]OMD13661.1 hypothetical protein BJP50_23445 [Paenibacillus odorifer]OMD30110.1 hypothetical protein BJP51_21425 [Paenibacillus odorifer]